jgi:putative peptidoglycan lipid II flippase
MDFIKSAAVISLCTLLSRIFGFLRDVFFAKYLGTGSSADIFFIAHKLPNFFRSLFAEGALNSAFVPILSSYMVSNDRNKVTDFLRNLFSLLLYFVLFFTVVIEIFMPLLVKVVASGFLEDREKYTLAVTLSRITFPYLLLISPVSLMGGILHSHGKFLAVALNPLLLNLVFIVLSVTSHFFDSNILYILSYGLIVGGILQFIFMFIGVLGQEILLYPIGIKIDKMTRKFMSSFFSAIVSSGIDQINAVVDSIMASRIVGAVSQLYYADRLVQLPLSLVGTAIGTSILPLLSKKIEKNNNEISKIQENALLLTLFLGLPCALYLHKLSPSFVPLLFENGEFTRASSMAVARCIKIYAFALPIFMMSKILQSIFFSNGDTKTPVIAALISLVSNVLLNLILAKHFGCSGIVISSVISGYLDFLTMLAILLRRGKLILSRRFSAAAIKILCSLIFLWLTVTLTDGLIPAGQTKLSQFMGLTMLVLISGSVYLIVSGLTGVIRIRDYVKLNS